MRNIMRLIGVVVFLFIFTLTFSFSQKTETIDGVRVVHNGKEGTWGKEPKVSLEFIKTIGDIESTDDNILFYMPTAMAFDEGGHVYVLDSGNHRIQKFNADGTYVATIGNKGQGPGEFQYPQSIDVDSNGMLYVSESMNRRIQILTPEGEEQKTIKMIENSVGLVRTFGSEQMLMGGTGLFSVGMGMMDEEEKALPKFFKVLNMEGEVQRDFGKQYDFKDFLMNRMGNQFHFILDKSDNIYVAFDYQNRIEKYTPDGTFLWGSDRELNYSTDPPKAKGGIQRSGGRVMIEQPDMNRCASGVAVDSKGRVWVVTLSRQIKEEERVETNVRVSMSQTGGRSMNMSVGGNTDMKETDMFRLEVYDPEGVLLGTIPVKQFVDDIFISGDKIYLLDRMRGMQFFEYQIVDK
ncbi:MAG: NHL repeat-containing protein [Candidatus Aminicenantaceae bacterium]